MSYPESRADDSWGVHPLCGSTNEKHMNEALEMENGGFGDGPEVKSIYKAMREAAGASA